MIAFHCKATELKTVRVDSLDLFYHHAKSEQDSSKGLIIFLHGGVSQFNFPIPTAVPAADLLERNEDFIPASAKEGYDVIIPVAYNEYNWLNKAGEVFIRTLLDEVGKKYDRVFIAGFSDGGTGSYRYFYQQPDLFSGLIVFNGYPQLNNYHKSLDYETVINKPVLFFSTRNDQRIPYEFLLVEYRRQKMINETTYFILKDGKHSFIAYDSADFRNALSLITAKSSTPDLPGDQIQVFAPIDGLLIEGNVREVYLFRKKIGKPYGMKETAYDRDDIDMNMLNQLLKKGKEIKFLPQLLTREELNKAEKIDFEYSYDGQTFHVLLNNYWKLKAW